MMLRAIGLYVISLAAWTAVMYPIATVFIVANAMRHWND